MTAAFIIIPVVVRVLIIGMICWTLALRGRSFWRSAGALVVADVIVLGLILLGSLLGHWLSLVPLPLPIGGSPYLVVIPVGLVLVAMLLTWEWAIRLAVRPGEIAGRTLGMAALALLATGAVLLAIAMFPVFAGVRDQRG